MIIGAMKCATSTLHEQLAQQTGIFMSDPKELYFFSDDPIYARGLDWYASHFAAASESELVGESTTHYTKLPTYPHTIDRIAQHVPNAKFIYMMRHPIERLISQYIHQWTEREITVPINEALDKHPELIAYSCYAQQLTPYFDRFGQDRLLPVFLGRLRKKSQSELERICHFINFTGNPVWQVTMAPQNASNQRMRRSGWRDAVTDAPGLSWVRRNLVPQAARDAVKKLWTMEQRPELSQAHRAWLTELFDEELATLGDWLGVTLTCENFDQVTSEQYLNWVAPEHD